MKGQTANRRCRLQSAVRATIMLLSMYPVVGVATDYTFTKIVDTGTGRPETADLFESFGEIYYDGSSIAFIGTAESGTEGVFHWNGSELSTIADTTTATPNAAGTFSEFRSLSFDSGSVAFISGGTQVDGVYTTLGGSLRRVADTTTIMPGSSVPFTDFDFGPDVEIDGNRIAFSAFGTNGFSIFNEGAYLEDSGVLNVVADRSDAIPDFGENFIFFSEVDVDSTGVIFDAGQGSGGGNGFYTTSGAQPGQFRIVYNADTPLPSLTQPNSIFSPNSVRLDQGDVAFKARGANSFEGIFIDSGGEIETVVTDATTDPVTGQEFRSFFSYTLDAGAVAFVGFSTGPTGIYHYRNGAVENVVNTFDFLDDKDVSSLSLSPGGLHSGAIAFRAGFSDGSSAVYLATAVPTGEPETIDLVPTVDVQLTPGDVFTIEEGGTALAIDGGFGANFPRKDALMEFSLEQIPDNASILNATLTLDGQASSGAVSIVVDGYAGDGLASTADASAVTTELAISGPFSASSEIAIELETDFVEALLGSATHLGLRLSSLTVGNVLNVYSGESNFGEPPTLSIEFQTPLPSLAGDYNQDGVVNAADYTVWLGTLGSTSDLRADGDGNESVDLADYQVWKSNYGTRDTAGLAEAPLLTVPEPSTISLMLLVSLAVPRSILGQRGMLHSRLLPPAKSNRAST